ncbi:CRISPR-associated protein Cas4 [Bacillus solimangrovi]|uniref:CRISPR-associated exonuclease Cas4 n=1 Tax=Bacillus solimangrovi TaxID=1305675 RepID=A0A1E5LG24_9BACI|nr:CRISPR-associated protein Cas4 [Bacillus solimangrovi]OEH93024.1 CRISPR-associated protein Cas4 [Bacillus solimangrovi]
MQDKTIGGIDLHYLALCKRKLWLYTHNISMENESDRVLEGQVLHENAYKRLDSREVLIDNAFKIDMIDGEYVREVKLSSRMTKADRLQMLYYLYQLNLRGIQKKGLISYTKERRTEEILLGDEEKKEIEQAITEVHGVRNLPSPPSVIKLPYCRKCAYYSFCYSIEVSDDDA